MGSLQPVVLTLHFVQRLANVECRELNNLNWRRREAKAEAGRFMKSDSMDEMRTSSLSVHSQGFMLVAAVGTTTDICLGAFTAISPHVTSSMTEHDTATR